MLKTKRIEGMKIDDENSRKLERARILPVEEKAEHTSSFGRCRSSLNTATALGFIILFLDTMLLTALGTFQNCHIKINFPQLSTKSYHSGQEDYGLVLSI